MNYREKMREYLTEPGINGSAIGYGKWGALNPEQRKMIRRLLDEMDNADNYIKRLSKNMLDTTEYINKQLEYTRNCMKYNREQHNFYEVEKYTRDYNLYTSILKKIKGEE